MEDPSSKSRRLWLLLIAAMICLPVLYVLSYGWWWRIDERTFSQATVSRIDRLYSPLRDFAAGSEPKSVAAQYSKYLIWSSGGRWSASYAMGRGVIASHAFADD